MTSKPARMILKPKHPLIIVCDVQPRLRHRAAHLMNSNRPMALISFIEAPHFLVGAADGNRTRVLGLEGRCSAVELPLHSAHFFRSHSRLGWASRPLTHRSVRRGSPSCRSYYRSVFRPADYGWERPSSAPVCPGCHALLTSALPPCDVDRTHGIVRFTVPPFTPESRCRNLIRPLSTDGFSPSGHKAVARFPGKWETC